MSNLPMKGPLFDDELEIIYNGGVIVEGEKIIKVGTFLELKEKCKNIHEITSPQVLLPGFIDCHTHICFAGSRSLEYAKKNAGVSYQTILSEGGGIYDTMNKTSLASDEELKTQTFL
jgi:imidazolonepropionase